MPSRSTPSVRNNPPVPTDPVPLQASSPLPDVAVPLVLRGQSPLVTGANSGIGRAVAPALRRAGADVVVKYVTNAPAAEAVAELGSLHFVVCNAGLQRDAPFHEMGLLRWNNVIGVNQSGQFLCARAAVRESCAAVSMKRCRSRPARSST